mgnify:CR=1 FL=1
MKHILITAVILLLANGLQTFAEGQTHVSPYAGQQQRSIKSLSSEDIAELRRGGGWGLAKAAELTVPLGLRLYWEWKNPFPLKARKFNQFRPFNTEWPKTPVWAAVNLIGWEREWDDGFKKGATAAEV